MWYIRTYQDEWIKYVDAHCSACALCPVDNLSTVVRIHHNDEVRTAFMGRMIEEKGKFKKLKRY